MWSSAEVAHRPHKPGVGGSIPSSATNQGDDMSEIKSNTKRVPLIQGKKSKSPTFPKAAPKAPVSQKFNSVKRSGRGR